MYATTKTSGNTTVYVMEFVVDTLDDIASLPTHPMCAPGSSCLVLENSSVWILGINNVWKQI